MKTKKLFQYILTSLVILLFIGAGVTVLVLKGVHSEYDKDVLGIILIVVAACKLAICLLNKTFKQSSNFILISSGIMLALGLIFLLSDISIEILCFGWGIMEIVLACVEIQTSIFEIKEDKLQICEIAIAGGSLLFGIILCIKLVNGLNGHLIFMSISLFLMAILTLVRFILDLRNKE